MRVLATKATATLSDVPNRNAFSSKEDIIAKIIDFENDINREIKTLVELKQKLTEVIIQNIPNTEQRMLLELRYLCFKPWEQIAFGMGYGIDNVFKIHKKALHSIKKNKTLQ